MVLNLAGAMESTAPIKPYTVPLDAAAEEAMVAVWNDATHMLRAHRGTYATALFGRYAENTAKLAMLAAVSRAPAEPVTTRRDVAWARALVEHCIGTLMREADRFVSDNEMEGKHKRVLELIRTAGTITRSDLVRRTQFLGRREREEILDALIESQSILRVLQVTATKPVTAYAALPPAGGFLH